LPNRKATKDRKQVLYSQSANITSVKRFWHVAVHVWGMPVIGRSIEEVHFKHADAEIPETFRRRDLTAGD
jgi:hypothetical protein